MAMISFIVPAYNEEAVIGATLSALHAAARTVDEPYEIIVADDASTDRTAEIASVRGARVITAHHRQIAATRNSGARHARGDRFIFVDADTIVPARTLRAALAALKRGAAGGGSATRFDGKIPLYARAMLPLCVGAFRILRLAAGCFVFCCRDAFEAVGGFDENLFASEEVAFSQAVKKHGPFVVLREHVITSGRKLRQYRATEILGLLFRLTLQGPRRGCGKREGLELWYEGRRESTISDSSTAET